MERDIKSSSPKDIIDGRKSNESHRSSAPKDIPNFYPISTSSPKPERTHMDTSRPKDEKKPSEHDSKSSPVSNRPSSTSSTGYSGLKSNPDKASPRPKTSDHPKDNRSKFSPQPKSQRSDSPVRKDNSPIQETKHPHSLYPGLPYGPYSYPGLGYPPGAFQPSAEALAAAGYPYGLSAQSGYNLASAHALAAHQAAMKSSSSAAALSQYLQYASRMRAPPAVSGCKDPYCTNCLASGVPPPGSHMSQCTSPGCSQCAHEKALHGLFGLPGSSHLHSPLNAPSSASLGLSHLHSLYAQNLLSQQGQQHVCNWMMGSDYCGKRFNSSEELLQHLRTHTSGGEPGLSAYSSIGLNIPSPGDVPGLPTYISSASPGDVRRMYPTSLSPLSGSSLSSRYHPYKTLASVPPGVPSHQPLSTLGPYYSPFNLYGQRIGSAAVP